MKTRIALAALSLFFVSGASVAAPDDVFCPVVTDNGVGTSPRWVFAFTTSGTDLAIVSASTTGKAVKTPMGTQDDIPAGCSTAGTGSGNTSCTVHYDDSAGGVGATIDFIVIEEIAGFPVNHDCGPYETADGSLPVELSTFEIE